MTSFSHLNSYDNPQAAVEEISKCISSVHTWLSRNLLKLNINKTNAMFVSTKSCIRILQKIVNIAGQNMKISSEIRLLGVIINNTLLQPTYISKPSNTFTNASLFKQLTISLLLSSFLD